RATFSRLREKATGCQRCSGVAPTPPFPRLRGKVPEGRMGATGAAAARATILIERQKSSTAVLAHRMH
ncbi:hypothetical protein, partial [Xanthomonas citri]|uniref:hypothetical protein n=1 Tax=Xanthomonas citri TaxID=346 RepID=UPI001E3F719A